MQMSAGIGRALLLLVALTLAGGCGGGTSGAANTPLVSLARVPLEGAPRALVAHRGAVWALNAPRGGVTRVDPSRPQATPGRRLGRRLIDASSDGRRLFVVDGGSDTVLRIRSRRAADKLARIAGIRSVTAGHGRLWAATRDGRVLQLDPQSGAHVGPAVDTRPALEPPLKLAAVAEGLVVGDPKGRIALLDARTNAMDVIARAAGRVVAFATGGHGLWVAVGGRESFVAQVDVSGRRLTSRRRLEVAPAALAQTSQGLDVLLPGLEQVRRYEWDAERFVEILTGPFVTSIAHASGALVALQEGHAVIFDDPRSRAARRSLRIDEVTGSYRGVKLGDTPSQVRRRLGRPVAFDPIHDAFTPLQAPSFVSFPPDEPEILALPTKQRALRYNDVFFFTCKMETSCARRVGAMLIAGSRAVTTRGITIGDPLEEAQRAYDLHCDTLSLGGDLADHEYCTGKTGPRVYAFFGGDPIDNIQLALEPFPNQR